MRCAPAQKRKIDADPVFRSVLVSQVINKVLWKGKRGLASAIVYDALEVVARRTNQDPVNVLRRAIDIVATAPTMPLSSSPRIDRDEIIELLEESLNRLPDELRGCEPGRCTKSVTR